MLKMTSTKYEKINCFRGKALCLYTIGKSLEERECILYKTEKKAGIKVEKMYSKSKTTLT